MDLTTLRGLDPTARRFWLVNILCQKVEPELALRLAERMEMFIVGGRQLEARRDERVAAERCATAAEPAPKQEATHAAEVITMQPPPGVRLLEGDRLREFVAAAAAGVDNAELGRRFGLTPRQANGIRLGLTKRNILRRMVPKPPAPPRPVIDREAELRLQEDFLRRRGPMPKNIEDVIRFLRQRGDIVVRAKEGFLVNHRLPLTAAQLVERANGKLAQLGQPPFPSDVWTVNPIAAVPDPPRQGAHALAPQAAAAPP